MVVKVNLASITLTLYPFVSFVAWLLRPLSLTTLPYPSLPHFPRPLLPLQVPGVHCSFRLLCSLFYFPSSPRSPLPWTVIRFVAMLRYLNIDARDKTRAGLHETVTWRGGGEVVNEVASGGGDGNGVCYGRAGRNTLI
ncbi:hypothetical protein E2C01_031053 [Portunus trituberculatus]|uniref:Uncharacterized protein n=1 Tax=Portunus trituberculatus TaxID=210409 RepID=A0A5B7EWL5_PORTR|nr:hypothetical protein [Portunus trituberculatus]